MIDSFRVVFSLIFARQLTRQQLLITLVGNIKDSYNLPDSKFSDGRVLDAIECEASGF